MKKKEKKKKVPQKFFKYLSSEEVLPGTIHDCEKKKKKTLSLIISSLYTFNTIYQELYLQKKNKGSSWDQKGFQVEPLK